MTPPRDEEVWVCVKLTRAQCVGQDDEGATPRIAAAIRAALERKGEAWVGWESKPNGRVGSAVVTPHPGPGCIPVLVVRLEEP